MKIINIDKMEKAIEERLDIYETRYHNYTTCIAEDVEPSQLAKLIVKDILKKT